jgi:hypothetical protein
MAIYPVWASRSNGCAHAGEALSFLETQRGSNLSKPAALPEQSTNVQRQPCLEERERWGERINARPWKCKFAPFPTVKTNRA